MRLWNPALGLATHIYKTQTKNKPQKRFGSFVSRLGTLVWVLPLGLGGQEARLVVLEGWGGRGWPLRYQAFSLMASRLWPQGADFPVPKVAVGGGDTRFLVGD